MMDVDEPKAAVEKKIEQDDVDKSPIIADIIRCINYITKGVESNQPRFVQKAIRQNAVIRKNINKTQIEYILKKFVPSSCPVLSSMIKSAEKIPLVAATDKDLMEMDPVVPVVDPTTTSVDKTKNLTKTTTPLTPPITDEDIKSAMSSLPPATQILPEVEVYIYIVILVTMIRYAGAKNAIIQYQDIVESTNYIVDHSRSYNRRSLDLLNSKVYFYFSFVYEKVSKLENIRPAILALYRTSCIRHDEMSQAVLLNLVLRNYLHYNLIEQANTFSLRTTFPENVSNNQYCRYLYYMGRIQAIQLEYTESFQRLMLASRKAPQDTAQGFNVLIHKLSILVQLLMGEIPEKSIFNQKNLRVSLEPYLALTQTVRSGDLQEFHNVVKTYEMSFQQDKNLTLVYRLGHNVIKTGLRKISLSYSRISLADVALKLHLASASSAEYICAKAIRDGVIEASIDHDKGWLVSTEVLDVYSTEEPQNTFHKRIAFCLDVYNEGIRSMRYPPAAYKKELQGGKSKGSADEEKSIEELIKEMEDDLDE